MIKVYRKGNFTTSHERSALRNICNLLNEHFDGEEDVYLLANIDVAPPPVTYISKFGQEVRKKKIKKSAPDLIIIKKDAIAVVEMKAHAGKISFPLRGKEVNTGEWNAKFKDFPMNIINEGYGVNPYSQVNINRKAFVAYLRENEKDFSSKDSEGSNWDKAQAFILFTNSTVDFAYGTDERNERGNWNYNTHLGTLHESKNGEFFPHFIKDITTGPRVYKKDERSEILFSKDCVQKLCELLECKDVTKEYVGVEEELIDDPTITTALGFAPTLIRGIEHKEDDKLKTSFKPQDKVLKLPRELRILTYYRRCLMEESKQEMQIFLNAKHADEKRYSIAGIRETIFSNNSPMKVPEETIHLLNTKLRQPNPSLSFGFSILIGQKILNGKKLWIGEPLFSTRINYKNGSYYCAYKNDITVNKNVLGRIPPFSKLHESQLEERIDEIFQEDGTPSVVIKKIFEQMGLLKSSKIESLMVLRGMDFKTLEKGFKPSCGIIYLSESSVNSSLLKELRLIQKMWQTKLDKMMKLMI